MKLDLTGKWLFKAGYDKEFSECVVPGTTICDMIAQNRIKNPLFNPFKGVSDDKDATFANLGLTDFIYKKSFSVSEDFLKAKKIYLVSKCLDTLVLIYLNGREVTHHENAFTEFRDEVKEFLVPGENVLEYHLWTQQWTDMLQASKFSQEKWPLAFELLNNCGGENHEGYIGFQDHGDDVWYRNIRIKVLE